eukprot:scaffold2244_cov363-Pavlova_lutheri.AAC.23
MGTKKMGKIPNRNDASWVSHRPIDDVPLSSLLPCSRTLLFRTQDRMQGRIIKTQQALTAEKLPLHDERRDEFNST